MLLQTIDEFLSTHASKGPEEVAVPSSEFKTYDSADLDVVFLLALMRAQHPSVRHIMCVPDFYLCMYTSAESGVFLVHEDTKACSPKYKGGERVMKIRAGAVFLGVQTPQPRFFLPREAMRAIKTCKRRTKIIVCNMGIYPTHDPRRNGHANTLIFNVIRKTVERFDPMGTPGDTFEPHAARQLETRFPGWKYVGMNTMLQGHPRGPQRIADAFRGLCVTYALWYTLMRLLNPSESAPTLVTHMLSYTPAVMRDRALRLNKYAVEVLKQHPRGSLVRHGTATVRNLSCRQLSKRRSRRFRNDS